MRRFESYRGHFFYSLACANAVIGFSSRDAAHLATDYYVRQFRDMKIIPTSGLIAPASWSSLCGRCPLQTVRR